MQKKLLPYILAIGAMLLIAGGVYAVASKPTTPTLALNTLSLRKPELAKPVIYLYPTKTTNVQIQLDKVDLSQDIPKYKNGWYVEAQPNGKLKDLQPQYTSCKDLDNTQFGLEYSKLACKKNDYPYIYWSGKSKTDYPSITKGFIVDKKDLTKFMNEKLNELGLNDKEKFDMLEYWLPIMSEKKKPYYRISFLTNAEMDKMAPLNVQPAPDSVLRVFLDYETLDAKPKKQIESQTFAKFIRKGFTLVEWGGAKR